MPTATECAFNEREVYHSAGGMGRRKCANGRGRRGAVKPTAAIRPDDERTTGQQDNRSRPAIRRRAGRDLSSFRPCVLLSRQPHFGEAPAVRPGDDIDDADEVDEPRTKGRRKKVRP